MSELTQPCLSTKILIFWPTYIEINITDPIFFLFYISKMHAVFNLSVLW